MVYIRNIGVGKFVNILMIFLFYTVVRVYKGNDLITTYNVPQNKEGTVWHVFEITEEGISSINEFEYNSNVSNID